MNRLPFSFGSEGSSLLGLVIALGGAVGFFALLMGTADQLFKAHFMIDMKEKPYDIVDTFQLAIGNAMKTTVKNSCLNISPSFQNLPLNESGDSKLNLIKDLPDSIKAKYSVVCEQAIPGSSTSSGRYKFCGRITPDHKESQHSLYHKGGYIMLGATLRRFDTGSEVSCQIFNNAGASSGIYIYYTIFWETEIKNKKKIVSKNGGFYVAG